MNRFVIKKPNGLLVVSLIQLLLLFFYFTLNITNVGEMGTALPLLDGFVALAGAVFFLQLMKNQISLRQHFVVFLLFVLWVVLRVIVDLGDMEHLKQLTLATTGGILLFFLLGTFARNALDTLININLKLTSSKLILLTFLLVSTLIFLSFKGRLLDRDDIFYITDVEGGYQRPGNFLIILFVMTSFAFISITSHPRTRKIISLFVWLGIYSISLALALISSQMIGSNAATANLLALYLMTCVLALLSFNKSIRHVFYNKKLRLPLSKRTCKKLIKYAITTLVAVIFLSIIAIQATGFDLSKTRAFGFGTGSNSSVTSRFDILLETGATQMGYAPFLGNVNVAELTTGNAGRTLHNFIPNLLAELGLVGLLIVLTLLFLVGRHLVRNIKKASKEGKDLGQAIISLWLLFVLLFLFLYANLSVGKSWPVMWFYLGFAVSVLVTKVRRFVDKDVSEQLEIN